MNDDEKKCMALLSGLSQALNWILPEFLLEMFSYKFLVRAVVVGLLVSLCAALLGGEPCP